MTFLTGRPTQIEGEFIQPRGPVYSSEVGNLDETVGLTDADRWVIVPAVMGVGEAVESVEQAVEALMKRVNSGMSLKGTIHDRKENETYSLNWVVKGGAASPAGITVIHKWYSTDSDGDEEDGPFFYANIEKAWKDFLDFATEHIWPEANDTYDRDTPTQDFLTVYWDEGEEEYEGYEVHWNPNVRLKG